MRRAGALAAALALVPGLFCLWWMIGRQPAPQQPQAVPANTAPQTAEWQQVRREMERAAKRGAVKPAAVSKERKGHKRMDYQVSESGDPSYDGKYTQSGDNWTNGTRWLWYSTGSAVYVLSPAVDDSQPSWAYLSSTLPGTAWDVGEQGGTAPAPTVTEQAVSEPVPGDSDPYNMAYLNNWSPAELEVVVTSSIAPCKMNLQGVEHIVFAFLEPAPGGFLLFNMVDETWRKVDAQVSLLETDGPMAGLKLPPVPTNIKTLSYPIPNKANRVVAHLQRQTPALNEKMMRVAIHECGHAVVAYAVGAGVNTVTIYRDRDTCALSGDCEPKGIPFRTDGESATVEDVLRQCTRTVAHTLAGQQADRLLLGLEEQPEWAGDAWSADVTLKIAAAYGGDAEAIRAEAQALAEKTLRRYEGMIWQLAKRLVRKGRMSGEEFANLLAAAG